MCVSLIILVSHIMDINYFGNAGIIESANGTSQAAQHKPFDVDRANNMRNTYIYICHINMVVINMQSRCADMIWCRFVMLVKRSVFNFRNFVKGCVAYPIDYVARIEWNKCCVHNLCAAIKQLNTHINTLVEPPPSISTRCLDGPGRCAVRQFSGNVYASRFDSNAHKKTLPAH